MIRIYHFTVYHFVNSFYTLSLTSLNSLSRCGIGTATVQHPIRWFTVNKVWFPIHIKQATNTASSFFPAFKLGCYWKMPVCPNYAAMWVAISPDPLRTLHPAFFFPYFLPGLLGSIAILDYLNEWSSHYPVADTITLSKENFIRTCHGNKMAEYWYWFVTIRAWNLAGVAIYNPLWWPENWLSFMPFSWFYILSLMA